MKLIEIIERVQRRATKYILSLPYRTDISYKERLRLTELIPLCYWHEYLDLVYSYKSIVNNTDTNFKISKPIRVTRFIIQLHFVEYKLRPRRVQISRGMCTLEDRFGRFSRNAQATNLIQGTKKNVVCQ